MVDAEESDREFDGCGEDRNLADIRTVVETRATTTDAANASLMLALIPNGKMLLSVILKVYLPFIAPMKQSLKARALRRKEATTEIHKLMDEAPLCGVMAAPFG